MIEILSAEQIKEWDQFTIKNEPVSSIDLMERAAKAFVEAFVGKVESSRPVDIVCGPGNNGGDGFAIGRLLTDRGFKVACYLVDLGSKLSQDCRTNYTRFKELGQLTIVRQITDLKLNGEIIVDALFGSGLNRPASGLAGEAIQAMNQTNKTIVAVDIPSGLFADKVNLTGKLVQAKWTITFERPKLAFLVPETGKYVGEWTAIDIGLHPGFIPYVVTDFYLLDSHDVINNFPNRQKYAHKGDFGKVLLLAGSKGKMGAAYLSAKAALKSGVGLLTVHMPRVGYTAFQGLLPEAMVSIDEDEDISSKIEGVDQYDVIAMGPGLGTALKTKELLKSMFTSFNRPVIIDADALNIIASERAMLEMVPKGSVLTPHVGEFHRLFGSLENGLQRIDKMKKVARERKIVIVLKGAHSVIVSPDGKVLFNNTGNPGMATGGCGDVLTGIIAGMMALGVGNSLAAALAVYLHGWAGDLAAKKVGKTSLMASDLLCALPEIFSNVESEDFI